MSAPEWCKNGSSLEKNVHASSQMPRPFHHTPFAISCSVQNAQILYSEPQTHGAASKRMSKRRFSRANTVLPRLARSRKDRPGKHAC
ncbi:hypothetical protein BaRGS_00014050 [Batillaria attramentaria]|uniref:Uncharacterized protein n=1 Tax=Batillaria attramentaria TaxID=370345 RepID=A0ABD0L690_9CAEN